METNISRITDQINELRSKRNAVILAHYYQPGEVQDLADFVGDSLALCVKAAATEASVIVFAGVSFMAESAKLLNPDKTVLLPEASAGCPMADMITAEKLRALKAEHPDAAVVCYVNSSAGVKAESDISCTSSNAVKVVSSIPEDRPVIFVPDKHLGQYVMEQTGRELILWPGFCPTHQRFLPQEINEFRLKHPGAEVLTHPECPRPVKEVSDFLGSTGQIIEYCATSPRTEFIICTEEGVCHELRKRCPGKQFFVPTQLAVCPNMKKTTPASIRDSLLHNRHQISVDPATAAAANRSLQRMLDL